MEIKIKEIKKKKEEKKEWNKRQLEMGQNEKNVVFKAYFEWMIGIDPKNEGLGFNVTKMYMEMSLKLGLKFKKERLRKCGKWNRLKANVINKLGINFGIQNIPIFNKVHKGKECYC